MGGGTPWLCSGVHETVASVPKLASTSAAVTPTGAVLVLPEMVKLAMLLSVFVLLAIGVAVPAAFIFTGRLRLAVWRIPLPVRTPFTKQQMPPVLQTGWKDPPPAAIPL